MPTWSRANTRRGTSLCRRGAVACASESERRRGTTVPTRREVLQPAAAAGTQAGLGLPKAMAASKPLGCPTAEQERTIIARIQQVAAAKPAGTPG